MRDVFFGDHLSEEETEAALDECMGPVDEWDDEDVFDPTDIYPELSGLTGEELEDAYEQRVLDEAVGRLNRPPIQDHADECGR